MPHTRQLFVGRGIDGDVQWKDMERLRRVEPIEFHWHGKGESCKLDLSIPNDQPSRTTCFTVKPE